jgi:hypothetical protein
MTEREQIEEMAKHCCFPMWTARGCKWFVRRKKPCNTLSILPLRRKDERR